MSSLHWLKAEREAHRRRVSSVELRNQDLEAQLNFLKEELASIASGVYFSVDACYSIETRLQLRCAKALKTASKMPLQRL